jgi:hypothetical protein
LLRSGTIYNIQWNLGRRTTLILNKSVPEHNTKTKNAPVSEQNFGSRTGKLATRYVRCTAGERQLRHSFSSVQPPARIFCAFSRFSLCMKYCYKGLNKQSSEVRERIIHFALILMGKWFRFQTNRFSNSL